MDFGLLVIDEGHHEVADSYQLVLDWYKKNPDLKVLLTTATATRGDGIGLANVCDSVAYRMDSRKAIHEGWLVPIRQRFVKVNNLDLTRVSTKADGDFSDGELERAFLGTTSVEEEKLLHSIAAPVIEEADGKPILVFAAGVEHAEKLCCAFNAYLGIHAEFVVGKTDKKDRAKIIARYKTGETQVLIGCGVFCEGFDAPSTSVVAIARPTKSKTLAEQMIGRGTRALPGIVDGPETSVERREAIAGSDKQSCVVLDFIGDSGRHQLVSTADLLAGKDVDPVDLESAIQAAVEAGESVDMEEMISQAKQEREDQERHQLVTRHRAERVDYTVTEIDPFAETRFDIPKDAAREFRPVHSGVIPRATVKQVAYLIDLGVPEVTATSYTKA